MTSPKLDETGKPVVHPVAALFPMLGDDELKEMAADIKERGLLQPIVLDSDGRILDGRNRYAACGIAGIDPRYYTYDGDDGDGYALAVNIERRHLSAGARAIINAQAARLQSVDGKQQAASTNLYSQRIYEANQVLDWAPDLVPNIVAGAQPMYKAVEEARRRKREAEALAAKMQQLLEDAPDLHALVQDETLGVDEALAALRQREQAAREEQERQAREEQERLDEEARREYERSVVRDRDIDSARRAARSILADTQTAVATILIGCRQGATGLITVDGIEALHSVINQLKEAT